MREENVVNHAVIRKAAVKVGASQEVRRIVITVDVKMTNIVIASVINTDRSVIRVVGIVIAIGVDPGREILQRILPGAIEINVRIAIIVIHVILVILVIIANMLLKIVILSALNVRVINSHTWKRWVLM